MVTTEGSLRSNRRSRFADAAEDRYVDAYRVANTIDWFGQALKVAGAVLGVLVSVALSAFLSRLTDNPGWGFVLGVMAGAYAGGTLAIVGVFVAAQGQTLKASVDAAVHSSPFLSDDLRAEIMSLEPSRKTDRTHSAADADFPYHPEGPATKSPNAFCYHCGADIAESAPACSSCGKSL